MSIYMLLTTVGFVLLLSWFVVSQILRRSIQPRAEPRGLAEYPSVTVIRPIKGLDFGAEQNIKAALQTGYPGPVEILFVFDDENEPAYPLVRDAIEAFDNEGRRITVRIIFSGNPPEGRTGKLNAMIAGYQQAKGEIIAFADSDLRPDQACLRVLVETLYSKSQAGSAFAPVVVTEPPVTFGDAGYALLINGLYGPVAAEVARRNMGELPFTMGEYSVFKREAIAAIDGLESAKGQLVDDMYLGARLRAAGYSNLVSPRKVPVIQRNVSFKEFWSIYLRWIAFSRSGLPGREFKLHAYVLPVLFWVGLILSGLALAQGWWSVAVLNILTPIAVAASTNHLHRVFGGGRLRFRHLGASFALLLMAPLVLVSLFFRRQVDWRGRSYKLNARSQLATGIALAADKPCLDCSSMTKEGWMSESDSQTIKVGLSSGGGAMLAFEESRQHENQRIQPPRG
jgi:ceramide glucosyltransferase